MINKRDNIKFKCYASNPYQRQAKISEFMPEKIPMEPQRALTLLAEA
jgi:hypothetical protein